jgi:hypothetical protein
MITLYELKQKRLFRCVYKTPFYVKNIFLMCLMSVMLMIIYMIFFRADGGSYSSMLKIMKGLNSNTFNYLESHGDMLLVGTKNPKFNGQRMPTTLEFFSECVRFNRPCEFKGLAENWPAVEKWSDSNGGGEYLRSKLENTTVTAYLDFVALAEDEGVANRKFSFRSDKAQEMTYDHF